MGILYCFIFQTTQRIIEDHKHLVEDLVNTGHELMALCTDEDAADIKEDIENVTGKHEEVKAAIREKLRQLDDAFRNVTTDVSAFPIPGNSLPVHYENSVYMVCSFFQVGDTVDGLLEEMHYLSDQMQYADPVSANRDTLKDQIAENNVSRGTSRFPLQRSGILFPFQRNGILHSHYRLVAGYH